MRFRRVSGSAANRASREGPAAGTSDRSPFVHLPLDVCSAHGLPDFLPCGCEARESARIDHEEHAMHHECHERRLRRRTVTAVVTAIGLGIMGATTPTASAGEEQSAPLRHTSPALATATRWTRSTTTASVSAACPASLGTPPHGLTSRNPTITAPMSRASGSLATTCPIRPSHGPRSRSDSRMAPRTMARPPTTRTSPSYAPTKRMASSSSNVRGPHRTAMAYGSPMPTASPPRRM